MDYIDVEKAEAFKNYKKHGAIDLKKDIETGAGQAIESNSDSNNDKKPGTSPWHYKGLVCCMILGYVEAIFFLAWSYVLGSEQRFSFALFTLVMAGLLAVFALCMWTAMVWKASCASKTQNNQSFLAQPTNDNKDGQIGKIEQIEFMDESESDRVYADADETCRPEDADDDRFLENPVLIAVVELTMPLYFYAPWTLLAYGGVHEDIIAAVLIAIPCLVVLYNAGKVGLNWWVRRRAVARREAGQ